MRDLERELRALGASIEFPSTPNLAVDVRSRLSQIPERPTAMRRLALVAAALAIAVAAGLAVPQARSAILRLFGIGAVEVELVDRLPEIALAAPLVLGSEIDPDDAPFRIVRPAALGEPDAVYASGDVVTLLYGAPEKVRLLVTEIGSAAFAPEVGKKLVGTTTSAEFVSIGDVPEPGVWIEGAPHVLALPGAPTRLAGNSLVWVRAGITLRLEGVPTREQAVEIAESMR